MGLLDALGGFAKGVGEGAWDGLKGTVAGVGHLAEDGYKLATDGKYREQTWNSALNTAKAAGHFAETAITDPGKAADEIGTTASHAWHALESSYHEAAAHGQSSEFIGQLFGQGAIMVGSAFIPGGAEADAAEALGNAGRMTTVLGDAGKLTDVTETAARAGALTGDAGKANAITADAGKATAITEDAGKTAEIKSAEIKTPDIKTADTTPEADRADTAGKDVAAPKPLTTITRREGRNTMQWNVDSEGRFVGGKASFSEDFAGHQPRSPAEKAAQKAAARRGIEGDQGGHMFAHRFVRDQGSINLVPQNGNLNNVAWGHMENEWADWIKSGKRVDVEIQASPVGADRPGAFRVHYDVVDPSNGKTVYSYSKRFLNQDGQQFSRVSYKDIQNWKG